jgi:predicted lipoprotein with Yx(FWY)xxD motif
MRVRGILAGGAAAVAGICAATSLSLGAPASATGGPRVLTAGVISIKVGKYGAVLGNRSSHTLYLLSIESGTHIHCTVSSGCTSLWPPLLITKGTKISVGTGVKGKVGTVSRSATTAQVTYNGYPVYTYSGDSGPKQSNGEKIFAFGGTWYMLSPAATTAAKTPVK